MLLDCQLASPSTSSHKECLLDSGFSGELVISQDLVGELGLPISEKELAPVQYADGRFAKTLVCEVDLSLPELSDTVYVFKALIVKGSPVILGLEALKAICQDTDTDLVLNFLQSRLEFRQH